jgi:hypothetical protein
MSKFDSIVKTIATKQETNYKAPQTEAPKDIKVSKSLEVLTPEERKIVNQGIIAKSLRQGMGQTLSDADKYGLEALARQKAPTLTTNLIDLVIESDILSPNLAKDMWSATTLGSVIPLETVEDLALAVTIDYDNANMRVIGEGQNSTETTNTFGKMKHFVYDVGGYSSYSYLAESRSIIDLATNKLNALQSSWGRAVESFALNGNNLATHPDANFNALPANSVEKFGKGLRFLAKGKDTVDFGGASLTDEELIKKVQEMGLKGGVYLDPNAVAQGDVVLLVTQGLYNRMSRCKDIFSVNSPLSGNGQVSTFMGIRIVLSSYLPQKTDATGVVSATPANNKFESAILVNKKFFKMYTYGSPVIETDRNIINKTRNITLSSYIGLSSIFDSSSEAFTIDATRKNLVYGVNILG